MVQVIQQLFHPLLSKKGFKLEIKTNFFKKIHLGGSAQLQPKKKSEEPNHFQGHLGGLKYRHLKYVYTKVQLRPRYPSVRLHSPTGLEVESISTLIDLSQLHNSRKIFLPTHYFRGSKKYAYDELLGWNNNSSHSQQQERLEKQKEVGEIHEVRSISLP
jgi:hypothetical protein